MINKRADAFFIVHFLLKLIANQAMALLGFGVLFISGQFALNLLPEKADQTSRPYSAYPESRASGLAAQLLFMTDVYA